MKWGSLTSTQLLETFLRSNPNRLGLITIIINEK